MKFKRPMGFTEMMGAVEQARLPLERFETKRRYPAKVGTMPAYVELRKAYDQKAPQRVEFRPVASGRNGKWETGILESFETHPIYLRICRF